MASLGRMRRAMACLLALQMFFISLTAQAQWQPPAGTDVVVLKDGSKIRGTLTEMRPGDHAIVQLANGQYATIQWGVIDHMERNGAPLAMPSPAPAQPASPPTPTPPPVAGVTPAPPPGAAAPPAAPAKGPETLPYEGDDVIPPGYHVKSKVRLGPLIAGSVLTAIGLVGIAAIASGDGSGRTIGATVWGVLFLGPGVPLLLVGLVSRSKSLVRDDVEAAGLTAPKAPPWFVGVETTADKKGLHVGLHF